jgi:SUKH-3 immunity protein
MTHKKVFLPATTKNLLRGGWFPSRSVDTSNFRLIWESEGLNWFDSTNEFLREFSGVSMDAVNLDGSIHESEYVYFKNPQILFPGFADHVKTTLVSLEDVYQKTLSPIGTAFQLACTIFIDSENHFYLASIGDYYLKKPFGKGKLECIADNAMDFIEYLQDEITIRD